MPHASGQGANIALGEFGRDLVERHILRLQMFFDGRDDASGEGCGPGGVSGLSLRLSFVKVGTVAKFDAFALKAARADLVRAPIILRSFSPSAA